MNELNELGNIIFLDRYAKKDLVTTAKEGDTLVFKQGYQKQAGIVKQILGDSAIVVSNDQEVEIKLREADKAVETVPDEMFRRVAKEMATVEKDKDFWESQFYTLLQDFKFVPGGRILSGAGVNGLSFFNCFVIKSPEDSRQGIIKSLGEMIEIMSRGGGVGVNLSTLRPKNAYVAGVSGRSSGSVSWGGIFSYATGLIEQGGCVSGETLIPTANGTHKIRDLVGQNPWIYSYDLISDKVVAKQAKWVAKTGHKKTITIKTDKGLILTLTPDHLVLMRDGRYVEAGQLKIGQRIMPLQRRKSRKEVVVSTKLGDKSLPEIYKEEIPLHKFFYKNYFGLIEAGDIHHIDGNHFNNSPENLTLLSRPQHSRTHSRINAFTQFNTNATKEQRTKAAFAGAKGFLEKWNSNNQEFKNRVTQKARNDNPMNSKENRVKNSKQLAISSAYKLINAGYEVDSPEAWDKALFDNRITKAKEVYGIGLTNLVPRSNKINVLFESFDNFTLEIGLQNHKIVDITEGAEIDVYDMEIPDTHNFAVTSGDKDSDGGIFIHNSRRGALMLMLADWHPDVEEFIDSKREAGKITNANISVTISDKFMQAVKEDKDWVLAFPDTSHPAYDTEWDGNLDRWLEKGYTTNLYKMVKARDLYNKIIASAWASAEPGVWFNERSNKMSNSWYFNDLVSTNPCFSADATLLTPEGLTTVGRIKVGDIIWSGKRWTKVTAKTASGNKQVNRYETSYGYFLGTENHRILQDGVKIEVKDAESIDVVKGGMISLTNGQLRSQYVMDGLVLGDGSYDKAMKKIYLVIGENDTDYFSSEVGFLIGKPFSKPKWYLATTTFEILPKTHERTVPDEYFYGDAEKMRGFLRGLFSANGSVVGQENNIRVTLKQSSYRLIRQVQTMLSALGIRSRITTNKPTKVKFNNGEYLCKESYDLNISTDRILFKELIGFIQKYKMDKIVGEIKEGNKTSPIQNIIPVGMEDVWDIAVDDEEHTIWTNGLLVANCGEIPLPSGGVCNLGAMNLTKYVKDGQVLWQDLYNDIQTAVRFLDNVIDVTPYFFDENERQQKRERRVGLNTMGLADMMIMLGIKYGSDGSLQFIRKLYKHIVQAAYNASMNIAQEKGSFPMFDGDKFVKSGYIQNMIKEFGPSFEENIKQKGMRNVVLLTQAPNGSTGSMVGVSSGIEPNFAFEYQRTSRLGKYTQKVKILEDWVKAHPNKDVPDYFITAMQLSPREHVEVLGAIQYWIDSAISKTCNVPNEYTVEQVAELYHLMYDLGAKGGTIYRDGSRDIQVLEVVKKEEVLKENQIRNPVDEKTAVESVFENFPVSNAPIANIRTGQTISLPTGFGTLHLTCNFDENNEPVEVFVNVGKAGTDLMAIAEGVGRLISFALQVPSDLSREERYTAIISQLRGIGGSTQYGFGPNKITSFPDAVSRAMTFETAKVNKTEKKVSFDLCPECGSTSLIREEACSKCTNCGYSKC